MIVLVIVFAFVAIASGLDRPISSIGIFRVTLSKESQLAD